MAECWENICRPGGFEITARAAELSGWQPGDRVLDLGCGTGASLHYLEEHMGLFMQGVEADASLCDAVKILYGDASTLPAEEESVDGILMECSFSRMEQPEQVLKECIRVLKPGGCLAVSDMIACGEEIIPEDFPHDAGTRAFLGRLEYAETVAARITRAGFRITAEENHTNALREMWGQAILDGGREAVCGELGCSWETIRRAKCGYYLWVCEKI